MKKYFTFAALAFALASCSNEEIVPQESLKDTPITVTAGVAELTTRAGYAGTTSLPETFYFSIDQDGTDYDKSNVKMTKGSGNTYSPETSILWASGSTTPTINAYTAQGTSFTVQTDQSTDDGIKASDLLGAVSDNDIRIDGNAINLTFRHLLCKLDVTYKWGTELDGASSKEIKSVEYQGFGIDATIDRATSAVTAGSTTGNINAYVNGTTSEAIFAPQVSSPKIVIVATIDGTDRTFSLYKPTPDGGFVPGNRYTLTVTIGGEYAGVTTATIASGWGTSITGPAMTTD